MWQKLTFTGIASLCATLFKAFDFPVFWPLLLFYFILLVFVTMKRQIAHMYKYGYRPWDFGSKNKTLKGRMKPNDKRKK